MNYSSNRKITRREKQPENATAALRELKKKLTRLEVSERSHIKFNPNPKKLFSFNVRF